jgi:hypothetical protein
VSLDSDENNPTHTTDASDHVATDTHENDDRAGRDRLPRVTPELFIFAGAIAAERAVSEHAERSRIEELLRRAVEQSETVRVEEA